MKNKNKVISILLSLSMIFAILLPAAFPIVSHAAEETIYIGTAEELVDLSKKCSYDAWSIGKTVVLTQDISLEGVDFEPIPSFSGVFDGDGHKIEGLKIAGAYSPAGLFSTLESGGVIMNLTLYASVSPEGDKGYVGGIVGQNKGRIESCSFNGTVVGVANVGGIAGINEVSGSISSCTVNGEILGEERVGGIAGTNNGLISSCSSRAKVNTVAIDSSMTLDQINLSLTVDISRLPSFSGVTVSDIGGVAGYTNGMIMGCLNGGTVGYPHVGYNVGGIAGRSSGHLNGNINTAEVYGRKDVGGIVGHMEPHISYTLSEDLLLSLRGELNGMGDMVGGVVDSLGGGIPSISTRLGIILDYIDLATNSLNILINNSTAYGDEFFGEINRIGAVLTEVMGQLSGITADIPALSALLSGGLAEIENALGSIYDMATIGADAILDLKLAADDISEAFDFISQSLLKIEAGLSALENALKIDDKAAAEEALDAIATGLSEMVSSFADMTAALEVVREVLGDTAWIDKGLDQLDALADIFVDVSEAVSTLYDATTEIKNNIDVNWDKFKEAGSALSDAIGHFADAARGLADAMELLDSGIDDVSGGLKLLSEAISVKDEDKLEAATKQIAKGFEEIVAASGKMNEAIAAFSDVIAGLEGNESISEIFSEVSDVLGDLATAGGEMSDALTTLSGGITTLLENLEIDTSKLSEGGALVIKGLESISDSLGKIGEAANGLADGMTALDVAIKAIEDAVVIKDEKKLSEALNAAYEAIGLIIESMKELATLLTEVTDTLKEAKLWSDGLVKAMGGVTDALSSMADALTRIQGGVDLLRSNVSFDIDGARESLGLIREGLVAMADASSGIKNAFAHLSDALEKTDAMTEYLPSAVTDLKEAVGCFADAMTMLGSMSEKVDLLVGYLKNVDPIQLPMPSEAITEEANKLFIYLSAIENELKELNKEITSLSSELVAKVGEINDLMNGVINNIMDMIYGIGNGELVDDRITESEIETVTSGKVFACHNSGSVFGDKNVGGIAGSMGIEYSLDPEDDGPGELTLTQKKQYQLHAVIHASTNSGGVTSKYDYVGGIVGKMDIGLVYGAENYGGIESQSGNYVGGVAGITSGLISQSFAKCSLAGGKYIGGVVGSGVGEDLSGESSTVRCCYTMVNITRFSQYAGAISGVNAGEFSENFFVSDTLAGIDRTSYLGKADPISYEDLVKRKSIPDGFYSLTLSFVADGEVIHTVTFEYGASFDGTVFPEIPAKEGHFGHWDRDALANLTHDTVVSVIYTPYITAIGSEEKRDNGREIFFLVGEFSDTDSLLVERGCDTSGLMLSEEIFTRDSLIESFKLTLPKDNLERNNLHFLPAKEGCIVFIKTDGIWIEADTTEFGSYLTFNTEDEVIEIAIVERSIKISIEMIIIVAIFLIQTVVMICIVTKRKKGKKKEKVAK